MPRGFRKSLIVLVHPERMKSIQFCMILPIYMYIAMLYTCILRNNLLLLLLLLLWFIIYNIHSQGVEAVWDQISTRTSTTTTDDQNYDDLDDFSFVQRHPNAVTIAKAVDRVDSAFLATTGNIAAIDFGTANCSIAYCTTKDEEMRLLKLSSQEGQVRVPTILLVNEKGEPIKFGKRAIHQYQGLDPSQRLKYHLFERIKLALRPHEVCIIDLL